MKQHRTGISAIELMIVLALSLVILGIASSLFVMFLRNYSFSFSQTQSITGTQSAITQMAREIRELRMGENGAWPVAEALDNSLTFYSDITNDGKTDRVKYYLNGTDLMKTVVETSGTPPAYSDANAKTRTIATHVSLDGKSLFTYYNGNWPDDVVNNPLTTSNRISLTRFIRIYLRIAPDSANPGTSFESTTGVQLRNLKENL